MPSPSTTITVTPLPYFIPDTCYLRGLRPVRASHCTLSLPATRGAVSLVDPCFSHARVFVLRIGNVVEPPFLPGPPGSLLAPVRYPPVPAQPQALVLPSLHPPSRFGRLQAQPGPAPGHQPLQPLCDGGRLRPRRRPPPSSAEGGGAEARYRLQPSRALARGRERCAKDATRAGTRLLDHPGGCFVLRGVVPGLCVFLVVCFLGFSFFVLF